MTSFPRGGAPVLALALLLQAGPAAGQQVLGDAAPSLNPFEYVSPTRDYQVVFPGGCSKLVARANEPDLYAGETWDDIIQVQKVTCDRYEDKGEGCSVVSTFNWHDAEGNPAGPELVIEQVEKVLETFGVQLVRQNPVKKDFGNERVIEGVDVFAANPDDPGEVWVRGLLIDADVHILTAWKTDGGLWDDPEYQAFFSSFQPFVD
jgi:hypothetical protein